MPLASYRYGQRLVQLAAVIAAFALSLIERLRRPSQFPCQKLKDDIQPLAHKEALVHAALRHIQRPLHLAFGDDAMASEVIASEKKGRIRRAASVSISGSRARFIGVIQCSWRTNAVALRTTTSDNPRPKEPGWRETTMASAG